MMTKNKRFESPERTLHLVPPLLIQLSVDDTKLFLKTKYYGR